MVKSCIYCKRQLDDDSVFDVCRQCGHKVWGENMYNAIIQNMSQAREAGDLYQGSVTNVEGKFDQKPKVNSALKNIAQEAIAVKESQERNPIEFDDPANPIKSW